MKRDVDWPRLQRLLGGDRKCLFGHAGKVCGRPAILHVLLDDWTTTMDCRAHAGWWTHHSHRDAHPITGACGLPDTTWECGNPTEPGRCVIDGLSHIPDLFAGEYAEHNQ